MPGNQAVYQESLRKAHNYAWDRKWPQAVAEYRRALAEFNKSLFGLAYEAPEKIGAYIAGR